MNIGALLGKRSSKFLIHLSRIQVMYHSTLLFNKLNRYLRSMKGEINRKCCCQYLVIIFSKQPNYDTFISLPPNNSMLHT